MSTNPILNSTNLDTYFASIQNDAPAYRVISADLNTDFKATINTRFTVNTAQNLVLDLMLPEQKQLIIDEINEVADYIDAGFDSQFTFSGIGEQPPATVQKLTVKVEVGVEYEPNTGGTKVIAKATWSY